MMWDLVEHEGEAWIYYGQQPLLQLHTQQDAMILSPARDMEPEARSKYLQGVLDGYAKHRRDQLPPADREGEPWREGLFR